MQEEASGGHGTLLALSALAALLLLPSASHSFRYIRAQSTHNFCITKKMMCPYMYCIEILQIVLTRRIFGLRDWS